MCVQISGVLVLLCLSTEETEATGCAAERLVGLVCVMEISDRRASGIVTMSSGVERGEYYLLVGAGLWDLEPSCEEVVSPGR